MNFGEAIQAMKSGKHVCRAGWKKQKTKWLAINNLEYDCPSFIYYCKDNSIDEFPMWYPKHEDMLAEDWEIKTEPPKRNISRDGLLYLSLMMLFSALEQSKNE